MAPPADTNKGLIIAAVIAAIAAIIAAVIGALAVAHVNPIELIFGKPSPTPAEVIVESPNEGSHASQKRGVLASGSVRNLGERSLWMLDRDLTPDGGYTVDVQLATSDGAWKRYDRPLGDSGQRRPFPLEIDFVIAETSACETALTKGQDGEQFDVLPKGCVIAAHRQVQVDSP